jgi:hypothetical protein
VELSLQLTFPAYPFLAENQAVALSAGLRAMDALSGLEFNAGLAGVLAELGSE